MNYVPRDYRWETQDGRILDIRWMDSKHLVHSFNLACRRNLMSRQRIDNMGEAMPWFTNMREELKARFLYIWRPDDQIHIDGLPRETLVAMCMLRAILDTKADAPGILDRHEVFKWLRQEPEVIFHAYEIEKHKPKFTPLFTKFAEYRLARTA